MRLNIPFEKRQIFDLLSITILEVLEEHRKGAFDGDYLLNTIFDITSGILMEARIHTPKTINELLTPYSETVFLLNSPIDIYRMISLILLKNARQLVGGGPIQIIKTNNTKLLQEIWNVSIIGFPLQDIQYSVDRVVQENNLSVNQFITELTNSDSVMSILGSIVMNALGVPDPADNIFLMVLTSLLLITKEGVIDFIDEIRKASSSFEWKKRLANWIIAVPKIQDPFYKIPDLLDPSMISFYDQEIEEIKNQTEKLLAKITIDMLELFVNDPSKENHEVIDFIISSILPACNDLMEFRYAYLSDVSPQLKNQVAKILEQINLTVEDQTKLATAGLLFEYVNEPETDIVL